MCTRLGVHVYPQVKRPARTRVRFSAADRQRHRAAGGVSATRNGHDRALGVGGSLRGEWSLAREADGVVLTAWC